MSAQREPRIPDKAWGASPKSHFPPPAADWLRLSHFSNHEHRRNSLDLTPMLELEITDRWCRSEKIHTFCSFSCLVSRLIGRANIRSQRQARRILTSTKRRHIPVHSQREDPYKGEPSQKEEEGKRGKRAKLFPQVPTPPRTNKILPGYLEVWTTTGVLACACARSLLNASLRRGRRSVGKTGAVRC